MVEHAISIWKAEFVPTLRASREDRLRWERAMLSVPPKTDGKLLRSLSGKGED